MTMQYYTYEYRDPLNRFTPFYVGKGTGGRAYSHLKPSSQSNQMFKARLRAITNAGLEPEVVFVKHFATAEEAQVHEIELIKRYGRIVDGGILTNRNDATQSTKTFRSVPKVEHKNMTSTEIREALAKLEINVSSAGNIFGLSDRNFQRFIASDGHKAQMPLVKLIRFALAHGITKEQIAAM